VPPDPSNRTIVKPAKVAPLANGTRRILTCRVVRWPITCRPRSSKYTALGCVPARGAVGTRKLVTTALRRFRLGELRDFHRCQDRMVELATRSIATAVAANLWCARTPRPAVGLGFVAAGVCAKGPGGQTGGGWTAGASRSYLAHTFRGYWLLMVMESVGEMRATDGGTHT
jgi:hypothetical protein